MIYYVISRNQVGTQVKEYSKEELERQLESGRYQNSTFLWRAPGDECCSNTLKPNEALLIFGRVIQPSKRWVLP